MSGLRCIPAIFAKSLFAVLFLSPSAVEAERLFDKEVRIGAGAKLMAPLGWASIPAPVTVTVDLDVGMLRIHGEYTHHIGDHVNRWSVGPGVAFCPVKKSPGRGAFQLKIPVIADLGFLVGAVEAGDGYSDHLQWFILGPSTGLDLSWWVRPKIGLNLSLFGGYKFRVDMNSYYEDGYSTVEEVTGFGELGITLGVVF